MPTDPTTIFSPACSAFPRYAGILDALSALISSDAPAQAESSLTITAGYPLLLDGNGIPSLFDFGDATGSFNTLRGYNAAHVYDTPGAYVANVTPQVSAGTCGQLPRKIDVTVVADSRPEIAVAANADLASLLAKTTTPTILLLPNGVTFDIKTPPTVNAAGISLRAASTTGPAPRIRRIASPGVYSTLIISGSDISIEGVEFDSDQPLKPTANDKVGIYAITFQGRNLLVRNCTFRNIDDGIHCQPQARGLVAINCRFTNELRACGAYLDSMENVTLLGLNAIGSVIEHIVRLEGASNVTISGCDVDNHNSKEAIAIRSGENVAITSNTIRTWARISQGTQAAPNVYCRNILFAANHFTGLRPAGPWLQVNPGSQTVLIDTNTFDVDMLQVSVAIQAPVSDVQLTKNQLHLVNDAKISKPLVTNFGNAVFSESGTATN